MENGLEEAMSRCRSYSLEAITIIKVGDNDDLGYNGSGNIEHKGFGDTWDEKW